MRSGDLPAYLSLNGHSNASFTSLMLYCSILAFRWRSIMFLEAFCFISVEISDIQLVCDQRTDRWTDQRTDGRTDIPSYRDKRTHLKTLIWGNYLRNWCNVWSNLYATMSPLDCIVCLPNPACLLRVIDIHIHLSIFLLSLTDADSVEWLRWRPHQ